MSYPQFTRKSWLTPWKPWVAEEWDIVKLETGERIDGLLWRGRAWTYDRAVKLYEDRIWKRNDDHHNP